MVIMDRQDYINKFNQFLSQPVYRSIPGCPTNKIKLNLIYILKRVKNQTGLNNNTHRPMYPMGCGAPKLYGLPKIHKQDTASGLYCQVVDLSPMVWPRNLLKHLNLWLVSLPTTSTTPKTLLKQIKSVTLLPGKCL